MEKKSKPPAKEKVTVLEEIDVEDVTEKTDNIVPMYTTDYDRNEFNSWYSEQLKLQKNLKEIRHSMTVVANPALGLTDQWEALVVQRVEGEVMAGLTEQNILTEEIKE